MPQSNASGMKIVVQHMKSRNRRSQFVGYVVGSSFPCWITSVSTPSLPTNPFFSARRLHARISLAAPLFLIEIETKVIYPIFKTRGLGFHFDV
jgi:hypothetical protein